MDRQTDRQRKTVRGWSRGNKMKGRKREMEGQTNLI